VGVRVDDGYEEGMDIPIYYDPMIAKLITYGKNRQEAILRMIRAIDDYKISGVQTTLPFCKYVMQHHTFVSGNYDTNFVKNYFTPESLDSKVDDSQIAAFIGALMMQRNSGTKPTKKALKKEVEQVSGWRKNRL